VTTPLGGSTRHAALLSSAVTLVRHPVGPCRALCPAEPPLGAPPPSATDGRGAVHAQPLERDRGGGRRTCGRRPPLPPPCAGSPRAWPPPARPTGLSLRRRIRRGV